MSTCMPALGTRKFDWFPVSPPEYCCLSLSQLSMLVMIFLLSSLAYLYRTLNPWASSAFPECEKVAVRSHWGRGLKGYECHSTAILMVAKVYVKQRANKNQFLPPAFGCYCTIKFGIYQDFPSYPIPAKGISENQTQAIWTFVKASMNVVAPILGTTYDLRVVNEAPERLLSSKRSVFPSVGNPALLRLQSYWCVRFPISIYLGWISVATIANAAICGVASRGLDTFSLAMVCYHPGSPAEHVQTIFRFDLGGMESGW